MASMKTQVIRTNQNTGIRFSFPFNSICLADQNNAFANSVEPDEMAHDEDLHC